MKYIKKVYPVEAIQWTGDNFSKILEFMGDNHPILNARNELIMHWYGGETCVAIGDYLIQGEKSVYPCDKESFESNYEVYDVDKYKHETKCLHCGNEFKVIPDLYYDSVREQYMYAARCPQCKKRVEWRVMN